MPYPFELPTTSYVSFDEFYSSSTHPSLPLRATSSRTVLRDALKKHKRLPPASQDSHLGTVAAALHDYTAHLFALDAALSGRAVAGEEVEVVLRKELEISWTCTLSHATLSAPRPASKRPRARLRGLESEIAFTLATLAYTQSLLARASLRPLYAQDAAPPPPETRTKALAAAMAALLGAHAAHAACATHHAQAAGGSAPPADVSATAASALAALALAEATLASVLKDDPYAAAAAAARNALSKDWMVAAPPLPPVRSHLLARLCLAAAEHAGRAAAALRNAPGLEEALGRYAEDLRGVARARAARFLGIDAEGRGRVGEGIAWLRAAKSEVGFKADEGGGVFSKGFEKMKRDWKEKREDRKIGKGGGEWGADAGRLEEGRILEMLEKKWVKMNDTVSF